jgi:hypothetical protein
LIEKEKIATENTEGAEGLGEKFSLNQDRLSAEWCGDTDIVRRKLCF